MTPVLTVPGAQSHFGAYLGCTCITFFTLKYFFVWFLTYVMNLVDHGTISSPTCVGTELFEAVLTLNASQLRYNSVAEQHWFNLILISLIQSSQKTAPDMVRLLHSSYTCTSAGLVVNCHSNKTTTIT